MDFPEGQTAVLLAANRHYAIMSHGVRCRRRRNSCRNRMQSDVHCAEYAVHLRRETLTTNQNRPELWLIRHGETEWSRSGQHTSRTDLPLTPAGEESAKELQKKLAGVEFSAVYVSPALRARETCRLAGLAEHAVVEPNLREWDYGVYEGRTTPDIQKELPGWSVWSFPIIDGESIEQVGARADAVIAAATQHFGKVALFAHAHILRILAARWVGSDPGFAKHLSLSTGSVSVLGYERDQRTIVRWSA